MDNVNGIFTSYLLELSSTMDASYFLKMKHILLQVDMISTGRYYDDVDIIQWNRKQPAIPFHEASVQRILRVWMRSAKIY